MPIDYTKRPNTPPAPPPSAAPPGGAPAAQTKVVLTKAAPTVSLTKHGGTGGVLRVNLNWNARPQAHGFFHKNVALDLDLGCLYEFADGTKGVVQALGNTFTARDGSGREIIRLDGDDRSGSVEGGENLSVDLAALPAIRRILVFALIYEGAANWAAAQGVVTMYPVGAAPVEVVLDETRDGARICAIAMLENQGGELVVRREVNYLDGAQRALDQAYGWGMNWTRGRK
ncbi:tellurium resistance protein [uncultured Jatrophihabitans sp.]|uniref:TerD family protein n=1 Tax=uncultured Jatrophihabitans sp. TaxID=1610747 RepID=UPI0035CBC09F